MYTRLYCSLLSIAALYVAGCAPDRPTTIPVEGVVTFQAGLPPATGSLMFAPLKAAEGYILRPAYGEFDAAGKVTTTSFKPGDGLVPGRYQVKVECWRVPPTEESAGESHVPANYVPQEIEVSPDVDVVRIKIDVPQP